MTKFTEGRHPGEGLLSEAGFHRSRGNAVIKAGSGKIEPGTILGKVTLGAATSAAKAGNTGNGTLVLDSDTPLLAGAMPGVYAVRFVSATNFTLSDPTGRVVASLPIGGSNGNAASVANQLKFDLTQGSTGFAAGDGFDITVAAGSGKYAPSPDAPEAGIEGAETACAIALYGGDATSEDLAISIIERDAEWRIGAVVYDQSVDNDAKKLAKRTQLAAVGIILR